MPLCARVFERGRDRKEPGCCCYLLEGTGEQQSTYLYPLIERSTSPD